MRKLKKPTSQPIDVFLTCISNIRDANLKSRLLACKNEINNAAKIYETKAINASLHTIPTQSDSVGLVKAKEMLKIYTGKMAKKGQPGRKYYDELKNAPQYGRCPLCGQRPVSSLDHHLPKTKYLSLSVVLVNLIPCCSDCNKIKSAIVPRSSAEETLHPYFDDIENERWLYAEVIEGNPVSFRYFVNVPAEWDAVKKKRVEHHFKIFEIAKLYSSYASEDLTGRFRSLAKIFSIAGQDAVRDHLLDNAESYEVMHINSWQSAMYRALAESDWFCCVGVNQ